jgi:hypothetical protein
MFLADNGSAWFVSGAPDHCWSVENRARLEGIPGSAFEVVEMGQVVTGG